MALLLSIATVVLLLGVLERKHHNKRLAKFHLRINVNGTRGKSTVTRLITAILKEAGYKVVGKTTGTSARMIFWDSSEEKPIKRGPLGPNIIEQKKVVKEAVKRGAQAFVTECMAVNPDYQIVFQEQLVKANVGVIVNVREDHLDLCGPTLDNIAESFVSTIPHNGHLIVARGAYNDYFTKIARERKTQIVISDDSLLPENYLKKFPYVLFPENASIALGVAQALGIDKDIALRGMLKAAPDPGALCIHPIGKKGYFVNAFAANDPNSTLMIWEHIQDLGYSTRNAMVIINCRPDRVDRTTQLAQEVLPFIEMDTLVVMGQSAKPVLDAVTAGAIQVKQFLIYENRKVEDIFNDIKHLMVNRIVFAMGNIHGGGDELVEMLHMHDEENAANLNIA